MTSTDTESKSNSNAKPAKRKIQETPGEQKAENRYVYIPGGTQPNLVRGGLSKWPQKSDAGKKI